MHLSDTIRRIALPGVLLLAIGACASKSPAPAGSASQPAAVAIPPVNGDTIEKSGIRYIDLMVGTGDAAQRSKCVFTRYIGRLATGQVIDFVLDTTVEGKPRDPFGFVIGQHKVISGWEIGVEGMRVGGYRRLLIPWRLGYGAGGNPPRVPPRTDLVFDLMLLKVEPSRMGGTVTTPTLECGPWRP